MPVSEYLKASYRLQRKKGYRANHALSNAKILWQWNRLWMNDLVKLEWKHDEQVFDDSYIDTWGWPQKKVDREREKLWEKIAQDGVWGVLGYYRLSCDSSWIPADSCWSIIGQRDESIEIDIRWSTIKALRNALKSRCPCCRQATV